MLIVAPQVRTRSDNNLEAAQYKLTMEELELFVQEIDNLCCTIEEGISVRELLVLGKQFVERTNDLLKNPLDVLEETELEALIGEGNSLRIELPQMQKLTMRLKQLKWYKRSQGLRAASAKLTYDDVKNLLHVAAAEIVPTDPIIDAEIRKLQEIGASIESWECQANKYFNCSTQRHELMEIEQFLRTATEIEGQVPSYSLLKDSLRKAKEWLRSVEQLQANDHFPYCHTLEAIVSRGASIPIKLEELLRMQGHLKSAHDWKENTERAFLKKSTFYTLLEVLMPRGESVIIDSDLKKPFEDDFVKEMNPAQIVDSFKVAEEKELRDMRELRRQNMAKNPLRDDYCLCKSSFQGVMYNCQLCRDWFHEDCVPSTLPIQTNCVKDDSIKLKWLCPSCVRSKRPRLETILPLLVSLQTLPIRLPEDEALRCLAERAMNWQDRARKALTSPDVTAALEVITSTAQQRIKQKKRKSANNFVPGRKPRRSSQRNSKDDGSDNPDSDDEGRLHIVEENFSNDEEDENEANPSNENTSNHNGLPIQKLLSDSETDNLEELMMEGDLLEVSLDESLELWRVLSSVQPAQPSEAAALVEQHQSMIKQQNQQNQQPTSSVNSAAEDSNDSLLVQSSPNSTSNSGSGNGRHSTNVIKKRRSLDPTTGCPVPRKKMNTPNKQNTSIGSNSSSAKKSARKSDANNKTTNIADDNAENYTPGKQPNGGSQNQSNNNAPSGSQKKHRKRVGGNSNNSNTNVSASQKKNSQRAQMAQQEDDEEECRAENCHKPTGREVDWVQCDGGCNEWFHMYCVGLNRSQIKADDDYICIRCSKNVTVTSTGVSSGATSALATQQKIRSQTAR